MTTRERGVGCKILYVQGGGGGGHYFFFPGKVVEELLEFKYN